MEDQFMKGVYKISLRVYGVEGGFEFYVLEFPLGAFWLRGVFVGFPMGILLTVRSIFSFAGGEMSF